MNDLSDRLNTLANSYDELQKPAPAAFVGLLRDSAQRIQELEAALANQTDARHSEGSTRGRGMSECEG